MAQHLRRVHGTEIWSCDECGKRLKSRDALSRHVLRAHLMNKKGKLKEKSSANLKCPHCPRTFHAANAFQYRRHLCEGHPEIHLIPNKGGDHSSPPESRLIPCRVCFRAFLSSEELDSHVESAHGAWKCPTCGVRYKTKCQLKQHERTLHTQGGGGDGAERPVKCDLCESYFKTKQSVGVSLLIKSIDLLLLIGVWLRVVLGM